ncbi:hypothetical protein ACFL4P_02220, partial [Gemmatimonadota bacterium]
RKMNFLLCKRFIILSGAVILFSACQDTGNDINLRPVQTPTALLSGLGECESQGALLAGSVCADKLETEVSEGKVVFTHSAATYNCCMESISLEIEKEGAVVKIIETENAPAPCFCQCDYTIYGEIVDLEPGTYEIAVCCQENKDVVLCSAVVDVP